MVSTEAGALTNHPLAPSSAKVGNHRYGSIFLRVAGR